ncbi:helix-turn-helix transcriptional regulator [Rubrolithibacter danxiaensis]|uniref:helix-turn-helix transcriptional regulator n=1 Tax=Rubrolithibacter danxiaensis TaxID=3390805 RepID=UPI003BF90AD5
MVFYKSLVAKSLEKRQELELTPTQLANRAGVEEQTIIDFEKGSTTISVESFLKIMDALNIALSASSF